MLVLLCADDFETILCGIYDAWCQKDHSQVRLELLETCQRELFCDYREVEREEIKAEKVIRSVKRTLSEEYFGRLYQIYLSCDPGKSRYYVSLFNKRIRLWKTGPGYAAGSGYGPRI